jgi:peptidoglycan hydrolase-like protein with peptidoglycan-binding domain
LPDPSRRSRPLARHSDVYTEADGLFGRLADLVIENPVRSGGFVTVVLMSGAIITNAAFFQTARHPDPFFSTRPALPAASAPAPAAIGAPAAGTANPAAAAPRANVETPAGAMPSAPQNPPAAAPRQSADNPPPPVRPKAKPVASAPKNTAIARPAVAPAASEPIVVAGLIADTQRALADSNYYDGPVDGRLGPQTRAAISSFEMKIGLIPTGQPTPRLLQQIRRGYPPVAEPASTGSIGASDPKLKRIQSALNDIGYGPIPEDGRDGAKTAAAIRHFEVDNKLPPTGRASDALAAKLVLIGAMPST